MIHIEYRYPWTRDCWSCFGSATSLSSAIDLLDACRLNHPGSVCRIRDEKLVPPALISIV